MTEVVVGMDLGGTKAAVAVDTVAGVPVARVDVPSTGWSASPPVHAARWIAERLGFLATRGRRVVALGVGAQGCNTNDDCAALVAELSRVGLPSTVVNDAALLVPAAGLAEGIGVIAGTGAIAVGRDATGSHQFAGGWGWVLGDDAGAAGIVREAVRAALAGHDAGRPDDGLLAVLLRAFDVARPDLLARAVNDVPTAANWAPKAPTVFAAADAGSARAASVIDAAADHLVALVDDLVARGAVGRDIVAAGGVIVNQPRLYQSFRRTLRSVRPAFEPRLLERPPVDGALALARGLLHWKEHHVH